VANENN